MLSSEDSLMKDKIVTECMQNKQKLKIKKIKKKKKAVSGAVKY